MAIAPLAINPDLHGILDDVAHAVAIRGIKQGGTGSAKAVLRVELEDHVRRTIQAYWTPFEASIPGRSIGLHLEVSEPRVHWAEAYLSPGSRNWYFCFHERVIDGEMQLAYYRDYATPGEAIAGFFDLSSWYVLTATDKQWTDVVYEISPQLPWTEHHQALTEAETSSAVQESLKKSTIVWLRWADDGTERTMPVWFIFQDGKLYVLSGERQQTLPGAARMRECTVITRWKGKNSRVAELPASVRVLDQGPEWDTIAEKIAEKRLNIPGLPEETARRWRDECHILEVTLRG